MQPYRNFWVLFFPFIFLIIFFSPLPASGFVNNFLIKNNHLFDTAHTVYLDGINGNDSNDGHTPQTAIRTVKQLLLTGVNRSEIIYVARGSVFHEFLDISDPKISEVTISDYGTGGRPVFDAADTADNTLFRKSEGGKNLYEITWTNQFRNNEDVSQYSVWEEGWRLKRVGSLEECDAVAGSYFVKATTQPAGTDQITVHSRKSDAITTNKKLYEITRRPLGIQVGDNCRVYNMHTRRNGSNDGSFKAGHGSYVYGVLAEDGVKHNFFMASGTAENCMAWKSDDPKDFGGNTLFISYTDRRDADTMNLLYKNCIAIAGKNGTDQLQSGAIGLYAHTGVVPYRSLQVTGGVYAHTSTAVSAEIRNVFIDSAFFIDNNVACSKLSGNIIMKSNHIILSGSSVASAVSEDKLLDSLSFINNKVFMAGDYQSCIKLPLGAPAFCACLQNTIFCNNNNTGFAVYYNSGGGTLLMKYNLVANTGGGAILAYLTTDPFAKTIIEADSNHYATVSADSITNTAWIGANGTFKGLAGIKAAGFETNSSEESTSQLQSRINGVYKTADFFLPKSDPLYGRQGSSSTFDAVERYPHWLGDTLGIKQEESIAPPDIVFDFTVTPVNAGNELNWEVEGIDSVDHYEIEFSTDSNHFSVVATIPQEPDKETYSFLHQQIFPGNNYYRVVAVGTDNSKDYSEKVLIRSTGLYGTTAGPNPFGGVLHLQVTLADAVDLTIQVITIDGKMVFQSRQPMAAGRQVVDLNLQSLVPGMYNLQVKTGRETKNFRVIRQ